MSLVLIMVALLALIVYFGIIMTPVYAFKETRTSFNDGFNRGVRDAIRDSHNGHGFDPSCPSGHTSTFCKGYRQGYIETFNNAGGQEGRVHSGASASASASATASATSNGQNPTCRILCGAIQ